MNIKEYIESGIIETYVLGMLSSSEAAEVEKMADQHPEVRELIMDMQESMSRFATLYSTPPKSEWKDEILAAALADSNTSSTSTPVQGRLSSVSGAQSSAYARQRKPALTFVAIAASVVLLISLGINIMQYRAIKRIESNLSSTQLRVAQLETENQAITTSYKSMQQSMEIVRDPKTTTFIMKAVAGKDDSYRADIYWNATTEMVYLDVKSLPAPPVGKQYQLWALKDGKPIDMGVFNTEKSQEAMVRMGSVPGADAFAVTLEKEGGSPTPTMEQMYVYGGPISS